MNQLTIVVMAVIVPKENVLHVKKLLVEKIFSMVLLFVLVVGLLIVKNVIIII